MNLFKPHENLTDEVNQAIVDSQLHGGVSLKDIAVGRQLVIYTRQGYFVLDHREDGFYLQENLFKGEAKLAPDFTKCHIAGSLFHPEGSMLKINWVGRGMFLEFRLNDDGARLISTEIMEIKEYCIS